jgi:hypothetical protein
MAETPPVEVQQACDRQPAPWVRMRATALENGLRVPSLLCAHGEEHLWLHARWCRHESAHGRPRKWSRCDGGALRGLHSGGQLGQSQKFQQTVHGIVLLTGQFVSHTSTSREATINNEGVLGCRFAGRLPRGIRELQGAARIANATSVNGARVVKDSKKRWCAGGSQSLSR